jgi:hypothetical protein
VAFGAAQRRKTNHRKLRLELADVVAANGTIMGTISGTAAMGFAKAQRALEEREL